MADAIRARRAPDRLDSVSKKPLRLRQHSINSSSGSAPVILEVNDFKGAFSFDEFFNSLVADVLPGPDDDGESTDTASVRSGDLRDGFPSAISGQDGQPQMFAEADSLLPLFADARRELVSLSRQVEHRLGELKEEVSAKDSNHRVTLTKLERGMEGWFESFARLDARISGVGKTAARIGDHLQSADAQRETASNMTELIKNLAEFNSVPGDLNELPPLFTDDSLVAEAAVAAQKLRAIAEEDVSTAEQQQQQQQQQLGPLGQRAKGAAIASPGLETAVENLQEFCNDLENRLLARFDAAAQSRDLASMAECAKILSKFNRGSSAMQRYVASRPMFMDVEIMASDVRAVVGGGDAAALAGGKVVQGSSPRAASRGLAQLYKEIVETVRREASTIAVVFPLPDAVVAMLVQRVMEQRVFAVLDRLLPRPSLTSPPPMEEGGILLYLRTLASAYERTRELAQELRQVGCGDLDVEGLADALFSEHREEYPEMEQASLSQLFQHKLSELRAAAMAEAAKTKGQGQPATPNNNNNVVVAAAPMTVAAVTEFVRWNEEAVSRCTLMTPQPAQLATNASTIFSCLLAQVSRYTSEGLERAQEQLNDAAALRDRFSIGTSVSHRVKAAAAAAAVAAAKAGESSVRNFMVCVQRATTNVAMVQQHFVGVVSRLLTPVEGAYASCCESMGTAMGNAEAAAVRGLRQCLDTIMAEVDRVLAADQKVSDFRPPDDGNPPDHRPTTACTSVTSYLSRMADIAQGALEGVNKQAFMNQLGNRIFTSLVAHIQRFTFNASGGLRLKRDVSEYADFMRSFKAPSVDEKFEGLGTLVNVFIVAPDSLPTLVDGSLQNFHDQALAFIQLREDYKSAKIASRFGNIGA